MRNQALILAAVLLAALAVPALADPAPQETAFQTMTGHYLAIQTALAGDTLTGVGDSAKALAALAAGLEGEFDSTRAGVGKKDADACRKILPEVASAAGKLAGAGDLGAAREAFGILSEAMVAYRNMVPGDKPLVAYCPMAQKSWLQADRKIANPYYGSAMLRCGTIVGK